jgi:hypothetical protein
MHEKYVTSSDWESFLDGWNRELLSRYDPQESRYSSLFRVDGFLYASTLCGKLKNSDDPLSRYLFNQLGSSTRQLLEQYTPPNPPGSELAKNWVADASGVFSPPNKPGPALLKALVDDLNRLLQGPLLYDTERFSGVQLSDKAKSLIKQNPLGESLVRLNRMLIDAAYPHATGRNHNHLVDTDISSEVIESGWLGYPAATEDQIADLEARLGQSLPPSYRAFLEVSNGFRQPGMMIERLLSADEVDWFREGHQVTIDDLKDFIDLSNAVKISIQDLDHQAIYLLNPNVVTGDGEWEAIYFDCEFLDDSYPSFWSLMHGIKEPSVSW